MPTYNYKTLYEFCNLHKIILNDNYENKKINHETKISGKCITLNCQNDFNISFRTLLENNCYCKDCRIKLTNRKT
jgi:predicted phage-related endonuclease